MNVMGSFDTARNPLYECSRVLYKDTPREILILVFEERSNQSGYFEEEEMLIDVRIAIERENAWSAHEAG